MTEYQIRWGTERRSAGTSLPKARLIAIKVLEERKYVTFVGIFGNTNGVMSLIGKVGRTNTIFYTWETATKGWSYTMENFLNNEGRIVHPAQWFFHDGNFYY